jgi:hypothetical protein
MAFPKMPWETQQVASAPGAAQRPATEPERAEHARSARDEVTGRPAPEAAPPSDAQEQRLDAISLRERMIQELKRGKIVLASTLEKTGEWRVEGGALEISLSESYQEGIIGAELAELSRLASGYAGTAMPVRLKLDRKKGKARSDALPESVELVKKAFRGSVIQAGGSE